MQLFLKTLPKKCNIYLASDLHVGSLNTHYVGIQHFVDSVNSDPDGFAIIIGDLAEAICVDDKRFDPETADLSLPTPVRQYQKVVEILRPIADKILYINDGNHDYKLSNVINFIRDVVCKDLNIKYGTYSSKIAILNEKGKVRFKIFTTHGSRSISSSADDPIRQKANMKLSLKRILHQKAADCVVMACGHTHKLIVSRPERSLFLTDNKKWIKQNYTSAQQNSEYIPPSLRWFINTGSFLKLYNLGTSGYAERFGYDPVELGYVKVSVDDIVVDVQKILL